MSAPTRFDRALVTALDGPSWLAARRSEAFARFEASPLPSEAEEEWHYSGISELDLDEFAPIGASSTGLEVAETTAMAVVSQLRERLGQLAGFVMSIDGAVREVALSSELEALGAQVGTFATEPSEPAGLASLEQAPDAFSLLADAFVTDGVVVTLPDRARLTSPLLVVHVLSASTPPRLVAPRLLVELGSEAQASVVELLVSGGDASLVMPETQLRLDPSARLSYLSAQLLGERAVELGSQRATLARDAALTCFVAALGGGIARQRTHVALEGEGAESTLLAVSFAQGRQVLSFRTLQEHLAPRTRSELLLKGAVADQARSAYSGLVHMRRGARKADASQTNRNLVLSEGARADSVPNLEIEENDVRCSHASAVGPIDSEQRFYLETRGVPSQVAERLILLGFFEELLQRSPLPGFAAHIEEALLARLAASGWGGEAGLDRDDVVLASEGGR
jgi:Fe-S cluster assembly protein SufD